MRFNLSLVLVAVLLAGCASFSDSGLVPGASTGADVQAKFGQPAYRAVKSDGGSVLYYPQGPMGRKSYAAVLDANGRLQAIEQRLTDENIARINIGSTTAGQVLELFGPSLTHTSLTWQGLDVWEYKMGDLATPYVLWVHFSGDGIVRKVLKMDDVPERGHRLFLFHGHGRR